MFWIPVCAAIFFLIFIWYAETNYKKTSYYSITKRPYFSVLYNPGYYGEYLIYNHLKKMEADGAKFLFNAYIPKANGKTTEIDILMICSKGIVVFESKNYKGWIFGHEMQEKWCQVLRADNGKSRKEFFYNPIMQNSAHITHLENFIDENLIGNNIPNIPIHSIIAFSNDCVFKDVQIVNQDVTLIQRKRLKEAIRNIYNLYPEVRLDYSMINKIYTALYPCTQVSEDIKAKHRENIKNFLS